MYCTNCGNSLEDGVRFCPECGAEQPQIFSEVEQQQAPGKTERLPVSDKTELLPVSDKTEQTPTSGKTKQSPISHKAESKAGKDKRIIAIVVAIVVVILIAVIAIVAVNAKSAADAEAQRVAIAEIIEPWKQKVEVISTDASNRADMLERYNKLETIKADLDTAKNAGELTLSNGVECDTSEVTELIEEKESTIRDWFATDYESTIKSASLADNANAENTTKDVVQACVDSLTALKTTIELEKVIWGSDSSAIARYNDLVSRIETQLTRANEILAQIQTDEEAAAAKAAEEAIAAGVFSGNTFECSYFTWTYTGNDRANIADEGAAKSISNCVYSREFSHDFGAAVHGFIIYVMSPGTKPDKYSGDSTSTSQGWKFIGNTSGGYAVYADYVGSGAFSEFAGTFSLK